MVAQLVKSFHCKQGPKFDPHNPCTKARHGGICILSAGKVETGAFSLARKPDLKTDEQVLGMTFEVVH